MQIQSAVLFLVFNRPEATRRVFAAISQAKPPRLYVASDGPRASRYGEAILVEQVRAIAAAVDWPCQVRTLLREENLGCKIAISTGIDWFFENELQGIILEDDCLPNQDFFIFCETLLKYYADDERVWCITGNNFQNGKRRGPASYYFSRYNHVWGWATWRRAWHKSDMRISFWPDWKISASWKNYWDDSVEQRYWESIFDQMYQAKIDTWDYSWTACVWFHGGLTATPNVNLVSNIGFGEDSTHTKLADSPYANLATVPLGERTHPIMVSRSAEADRYVFDNLFGGSASRFPYILIRFPRRLASFVLKRLRRIN